MSESRITIIEEVREAKRQVNARYDNDIHKYCVDVRRRQEELKKQGIKFLRLNSKKEQIPDHQEDENR